MHICSYGNDNKSHRLFIKPSEVAIVGLFTYNFRQSCIEVCLKGRRISVTTVIDCELQVLSDCYGLNCVPPVTLQIHVLMS